MGTWGLHRCSDLHGTRHLTHATYAIMTTRFYAPANRWSKAAPRFMVGFVVAAGFMHEAKAVFTFTSFGSPRQIIMQVGSANTTVNNVTFNVSNANISPTPVPVTGTPGSGTPSTSPAGGTEIRVTTRYPNPGGNNSTQVTLTVSSPPGLACVAATGCGSTTIPFNTVSWTSYNHDATYPTFDIQDGVFSGTVNQPLTNFYVTGNSITMSNVLIFSYNNATLYPSGQYTGRVTYTAAIP